MRGSPLLRAIGLFVTLLALGIPLRWLTRQQDALADSARTSDVAPLPATNARIPVTLTFSHQASRAEIRHAGKAVWVIERPKADESCELQLPFPKEGIELGVTVEFEGDAYNALRLQLTGPEGTLYDRSVWGAHTVEAIVPFP